MMMLSQAAIALNSVVTGEDVLFSSVSKDTRTLVKGDLYVAIQGDNFDGHKYVDQAQSLGAVAALVSQLQESNLPQICVSDTRLALGKLAAYWAMQWRQTGINSQTLDDKKLIGITGSNGKTTVKEMCKSILQCEVGSEKVFSTYGNLNNDIGLPLSLLSLKNQHQYSVIEMGANHVGEIEYLTQLAKPDIAIITNAGPAHLEGFGSIDNVANTKAEIYNGLNSDGVAVINLDDDYAELWLKLCTGKTYLTFSMRNDKANFYAKCISGETYQLNTPVGLFEFTLTVKGQHNVMNALAAATATYAAGVKMQSIVDGLESFKNISGRLQFSLNKKGSRIIDDSYNANPLSVKAAIDVLCDMDGKHVLVLGDMAELGEQADELHAETGRYAKQSGVDVLLGVGEKTQLATNAFGDNGKHFQEKNDLINYLLDCLDGSEVVLVKGSRSAAMEKVVVGVLADNAPNNTDNKKANECF